MYQVQPNLLRKWGKIDFPCPSSPLVIEKPAHRGSDQSIRQNASSQSDTDYRLQSRQE